MIRSMILAAFALVGSVSAAETLYPVTVTDVAGREVTVTEKPTRIALSSGRVFPMLEMVYGKEAVSHLVAWRNDMMVSAPSMYREYVKDYPALETIKKIGVIKSGEFDAETFINRPDRPDLFLVDLSNIALAEEKGLLKKLENAGIKVLAVDFREDPLNNTVTSVKTFATVAGFPEKGDAFADYYREHIEKLVSRIDALPDSQKQKKVFIERAAGYDASCCYTFGSGNMGAFIPFLKATNIADKPLRGAQSGQMATEAVIVARPDVYIMQTTGWLDKNGKVMGGIPLGFAPSDEDDIRKATDRLMNRPWIKAVKAYREQSVYSVYMPFYNSPYNLTAMEYFAKWIYPEVFKDLDPKETFVEMNKRFADRDVDGVFGRNNFNK